MLDAGESAAEALTEYVRASGELGHAVPEPDRVHAAYTAEDGLDLHALDDDQRTLADAVAALEEALLLQDGARHALAAAWRGIGAGAAAENLLRHGQVSGAGVDRLRAAALAVGELRDRLSQLIDAKVNATQDIEARGRRAEWLGAARTVTTGAGDRADASETVDLQVAPFVANDIAGDWLPLMCDTESAIRQAYRDAISAITGEASADFGEGAWAGSTPVGAEQYSPPAGTATAGFAPGAALPGPAAPAQPQPVAAPPAAAVDPMAGAPAGAPFGSGMSGPSGIGQSIADILGGLFGAGGQGLGESLSGDGEFDASEMDAPADPEIDDRDEDDEDDGEATEDPEDEESPEETDEAVPAGDPAVPTPLAPAPEPAAPTPVPELPAEPMAAPALDVTTEPVPAETPCEIAADALPQAGP